MNLGTLFLLKYLLYCRDPGGSHTLIVSRACTSVESAGIAGASHLVNFVCTDTVAALGTHSTPSSPDTRVPDTWM
jgi:hypothetical protein